MHVRGRTLVVSFYNPVSKKRDWQLNQARDVLLQYPPGKYTCDNMAVKLTPPEKEITGVDGTLC